MVYYQIIIYYVEHLNNSSRTNATLVHPSKKTVSTEIIKPIHVELTTNKLV